MDFDKHLERIAQEYRSEGYAVTTHPDVDHVPAFAADFGVDMLAVRGDERVLVQVKKDRAALEADPQVSHRADVTNRQPGWRYDLVVLEQDNGLRRTGRLAGEPSVEQITQMLNEAERAMVTPRAAFVLAWAGLEAAMRRFAQRAGLNGKIGTQPPILVRELYSAGHISPDDFRRLEETRRLRTEIVHGLAPPAVDVTIVQTVVDFARRLLTESESMQAVAG